MKAAALLSGGKDSCFAIYVALQQSWEPVRLVTLLPRDRGSWMFHYPATKWTGLQAEAMRIPLVTRETSGSKESELEDLAATLSLLQKDLGIDALVSGAIASDYQKSRIDKVCEKIGIKSYAPLWRKNQRSLLAEILECGFKVIITAVSAMGLDAGWLGKQLVPEDLPALDTLSKKYGLNPAFEGGEAETLVLDAPFFSCRIRIVEAEKVWKDDSGYLEITSAALEAKS